MKGCLSEEGPGGAGGGAARYPEDSGWLARERGDPGGVASEEGVPQSFTPTKSEKEETVALLGFCAPFLLKKPILL